jgi:MFS family permease
MLCLAVALSLTTWFSATAITPELMKKWLLDESAIAWLTNGVQIGFVIGAFLASLFNLPDIYPLNRLMAISAAIASLTNATLLIDGGPHLAIATRMVTGFALAGVYPPALKLISTWFIVDRGLALGAAIGALTLGSALPHLFRVLSGTIDWHLVVTLSSGAALLGAIVFLVGTKEGPHPFAKATFSPKHIGEIVRNRTLVLVNLGYFGHMWELYAMWAWLLVYLRSAVEVGAIASSRIASFISFASISSGVFGCLLGGFAADRVGRPLTTAIIMAVSGACALGIGFVYDGPFWLLASVAILWGIFIIADSAQFSAMVTELGDRRFVGTALSMQMGAGFALTIVMIEVLPHFAAILGSWRWAFLVLVPGPLIGSISMLVLRRRLSLSSTGISG